MLIKLLHFLFINYIIIHYIIIILHKINFKNLQNVIFFNI